MPEVHAQLIDILRTLERHYRDMQDVEFTIEEGTLYMLQTRNAKRPAQAAVRVAVDMVDEGLLTREEALLRIDADKLDALLHPTFDPSYEYDAARARSAGLARAPPRAAIVFTADEAVEQARAGQGRDPRAAVHRGRGRGRVPRREGDPHLRGRQGLARGAGGARHGTAVRGGRLAAARSTSRRATVSVDGTRLEAGDLIAIDGTTGLVTTEDVPLVAPEISEHFDTVLDWADELRRLGVRANADTPADARRAREFGAEGIGLCRTEHMFMQAERQPKMQAMIMADDRGGAARRARGAAPAPARRLRGPLRGDGRACRSRSACSTRRCTSSCRTRRSCWSSASALRARPTTPSGSPSSSSCSRACASSRRRTRCSARAAAGSAILYPEIYEMQVRAIVGAALAVRERTRHGAARSRS